MSVFARGYFFNYVKLSRNILTSTFIKFNREYYSHSLQNGRDFRYKSFNKTLMLPYYNVKRNAHEDGYLKSMKNKIKDKIIFHLFTKHKIELKGRILYANMEHKIDYPKFFRVCKLPDTFFSWYLIMELHVWMLASRLMAEGEKGILLRNSIMRSMWLDVEERSKQLENVYIPKRVKQVKGVKYHHQLAFISYDESLDGDDKVLAGALWRYMFQQEAQDPLAIECCVNYVRKNLANLDATNFDEMALNSRVEFLPLLEPNQLFTT
ncbi:Ubiquinol-cytochrome-c reductase complex assembly factor 1 [Armadillidium nasatum]|uniref:Ubiquinol-cytochrome-c reductase complex assembly factor 1 n=1 Tax=Armadillidium nasatum TaxID=96803 RepID=A0A5N5SZU7_9CRUS|nr:Ubiquinol-cytochrome-c reductase complex assembly factor 1 [Armadillidium nasatum]